MTIEPIVIYAQRFVQHDKHMYVFSLPARDLLEIVEIVPNSEEHPNYPQREINDPRCRAIADYVAGREDARLNRVGYLPTSIVLNLYPTVHASEVEAVAENVSLVRLDVPRDGLKHAYCLDGQHRLFAFDPERARERLAVQADAYQLPVTAFLGEPLDFISDQFAMINTRQEKVNPNQIFTIQGYWSSLDQPNQRAYSVISMLNASGILAGKIKERPGQKGTLIGAVPFARLLRPKLDINGLFGNPQSPTPDGTVSELLKNYFQAWANLFPAAWGSTKHVLTKTAGWEVMLHLLEEAYKRLKLYHNGLNTVTNWQDVLEVLTTSPVHLQNPLDPQQIVPIVVDWRSEIYRPYSSGRANIDRFKRAFKSLLETAEPPA